MNEDPRDRVMELERLNAELNNLVQQMLSSTDELFKSQTWRVGYAVANTVRRVQKLFGSKQPQGHLDAEYFQRMVSRCYAFRKRPTAVKLTGSYSDVPAQYIATDVDVAMRDLWESVGKEYARDSE